MFFVLRPDAHEFIWILVRSESNTRITYICFYFISVFIIHIVEVTSSIFTQFSTRTMAPSLCDAIKVADLYACKCLVWFRMYCVYFFLIILGERGGVDKTIILRKAAANGPIVPSLDDWWFWIQYLRNDKCHCKPEVVEGKPNSAPWVHHKSHLKFIRIETRFSWQQPRGLSTRLLRSWVRIPPGAWIFVCRERRVLSGRGLCDELITRPEESYRLCCVVVCDLETSRMGAAYLYDISRLRVKLNGII